MSEGPDWKAMTTALIEAIFEADIPRLEKEKIFDIVLHKSPQFRATGDVAFANIQIGEALLEHERGDTDCE